MKLRTICMIPVLSIIILSQLLCGNQETNAQVKEEPAKVKKLKPLTSYVPDESFLVFHSSTKDLWATLSKKNQEALKKVSEQIAEQGGFGASDVEEVLFCLTTQEAPDGGRSMPVVIGFRWKSSVDREEVLKKFDVDSDPNVFGGHPSNTEMSDHRGPCFCFPGSRTLLIAEHHVMEKVFEKKKGNALVKRLEKLRKKSPAAIVCELNGDAQRVKQLRKLCDPAFRIADIPELADIFDSTKSFEASLQNGDTFAKVSWTGVSNDEAESIVDTVNDSREVATEFLDQRIELLEGRGEWGQAGIKLIKMTKKVINSAKLTREGKNIKGTVTYEGGFAAITNLSVEINKIGMKRD